VDGSNGNDYTMVMPKKKMIIALLYIGALLLISVVGWYTVHVVDTHTQNRIISASSTLMRLTLDELSHFDGSSTTLPIYIGLDGFIYDVSTGKSFYAPGAVYHYLAGSDASRSLRIMGADIIKQKYPIVGIIEK
jgi:predicted heme/steroid binding protein